MIYNNELEMDKVAKECEPMTIIKTALGYMTPQDGELFIKECLHYIDEEDKKEAERIEKLEEFWDNLEEEFFDKFPEDSEFYESDVEEFFEERGVKCEYCDGGIDDGCGDDDDCDDRYVMYCSFDVEKDGVSHHIIFYYGDNTRYIFYIDWR